MIDVTLDEPAPTVVTPTPRPTPVSPDRPIVPPATPWWKRPAWEAAYRVFLVSFLLFSGGVLAWRTWDSKPTPVVAGDPYITGRTFAPKFLSAYADAYDAAADALEKGSTVSEAQNILQNEWKTARTKEFMAVVTPTFESILPPGKEPVNEKKRAEVVQSWRDFARGMRGK